MRPAKQPWQFLEMRVLLGRFFDETKRSMLRDFEFVGALQRKELSRWWKGGMWRCKGEGPVGYLIEISALPFIFVIHW